MVHTKPLQAGLHANDITYAMQNKHPQCRSAFIKLSSHINFGKRKYGVPFTTEQVIIKLIPCSSFHSIQYEHFIRGLDGTKLHSS